MTIIKSLKWSFLAELSAKAVQPIVFILLATKLTPEDFGVMTAALMVITFSQIFWEAGMASALIQRQNNIEDAKNAAFLINITLGILISVILYLFAEPIALNFFQDSRVTAVLKIMSLQILFGAFGSVQTAILQKNMEFKKLFWVRFVSVILPGFASLPLAWTGWGYWSLVVGLLVGQFTQILVLSIVSEWRPSLKTNKIVIKEMCKFAGVVQLTALLTWLLVWIDSLIVAKHFSIAQLGIYKTASQLATTGFILIFLPVVPVIYSHLSRHIKNKIDSKDLVEKIITFAALVGIPLSLFLYVFSDYFLMLIFNDSWGGIATLIGIMAVREGFAWITFINGEYYRAIGKPFYETIMMIFTLAVYLPIYFYAVNYGLEFFSWSRVFAVFFTLMAHLALLAYLNVLGIYEIWKKIVFIFSLFMILTYGVKYYSLMLFDDWLFQFLFILLIWISGYVILNLLFFKKIWYSIFLKLSFGD